MRVMRSRLPIRNPQSEIRNPLDPYASSQWDYAMQEIDIE
jgi:hypothetical protein